MAKGQKRSGREPKKPKAEKKKSAPIPAAAARTVVRTKPAKPAG